MQRSAISWVYTLRPIWAFDLDLQSNPSLVLIQPGIGWAATHDRLFWTWDGGTTWRDVTPLGASRQFLILGRPLKRGASTIWV